MQGHVLCFYTVIVFNPPAHAEYSDNFRNELLGLFSMHGAEVQSTVIHSHFFLPSDLSEAVDVYSDWIDACEAANS